MNQHVVAASASPIQLSGNTLDSPVLSLAVAVGLLSETSPGSGTYEVNPSWFENPLGSISDALQNRGPQLATLITQLLGQIGGHALGIPVKNPGSLGTWTPINNPSTGKPTGLYLVSYPEPAEGTPTDQVFGLGVFYEKSTQAKDKAAAVGPSSIEVSLWGLLPVLKVGQGKLTLTLGQHQYPLTLGIAITSADGTPIINAQGLSFDGVKATATIDVAAPSVDLSLVIMQLKLPTDAKPADRSLADLAQISAIDLISTVATLGTIALSAVKDLPEIPYLLPTIGLSPVVPKSDTKLPLLRWDEIVSLAVDGQNPVQPVLDWFGALLADSELAKTWLGCVAGLINSSPPPIGGSGTREAPFALPLITVVKIGTLNVTAASSVDDSGVRTFFPGLSFAADPVLLGTDAQVVAAAALEVGQFILSPGNPTIGPTSLQFDAEIALTGVSDKPLYSGTIAGGNYVFGSLAGGVSLSDAGATPIVVPSFTLNGVTTPNGNYQSIDLLQPGKLVQQALAELQTLIEKEFQALFGTSGPASFGQLAAVLVGVVPPVTGGPAWPTGLAPPLSATQLPTTFQDPAAALGAYYSKLLFGGIEVGGKVAFTYVLQSIANLLLQSGATAPTITGSGKPDSPWLAPLATGSLPVSLLAYTRELSAENQSQLVLGLALTPSITLPQGSLQIDLDGSLELLAIDMDRKAGTFVGGQILPALGVALGLPNGVQTPPVAGASLSVGSSAFSTYWNRTDGWVWSMQVGAPAVVVDGNTMPVGSAMNFSDPAQLQQLVTQAAATFAPLLTRLLGVAAYRTGTRAGLALDGVLGLLPKLSSAMPSGLTWPDDMPVLTPKDFNDPLGDLQGQFAQVFSTTARTQTALTLIAWAAAGPSGPVPTLAGNGIYGTPFLVPVGLPLPFDLAVWADPSVPSVGLGVGRSIAATPATNLSCTTIFSFALAEFALGGGSLPSRVGLPGCSVVTTFAGANGGKLIDDSNLGSLGALQVGCSLGYRSGSFTVAPIVNLIDAALTGFPQSAQLQLPATDVAPQIADQFTAQLNLALNPVFQQASSNPTFAAAYDVLAGLNLTLSGTPQGINSGGWLALLADPAGFLEKGFDSVLSDSGLRSKVFQLLCQLVGVTPPTIPPQLLDLGAALGLLTGADTGYAPIPSAWIDFLSDPLGALSQRFANLFGDTGALSALVSSYKASGVNEPVGPFVFTIEQARYVTLAVPATAPVSAGGVLDVFGSVALDLQAGTLTLTTQFRNPQVGFSIISTAAGTVSGGSLNPKVTLAAGFGDGVLPAPPPLTFYPFDLNAFVTNLSQVAPAYALSTFVTGVVEPKLLQPNPLAQAIFAALGLANKDPVSGVWHMRSPLGLFQDPLDWLLSDAVIGKNGQLNIAQLATVLGAIPATSSIGVSVAPIAKGVALKGLPYGIEVSFVADTKRELFIITPAITKPVSLAIGGAQVDTLSFGLTLGAAFNPGFTGSFAVSGAVSSNRLLLTGGYNDGFTLSVGLAGTSQPTLTVVPFPGWQTLIGTALQVAVPNLLAELTDKLLTALANTGAASFATKLRTAGGDLDVQSLVTALVNAATTDPEKIAQVALQWLQNRVSSSNVNATVTAVATLLDGVVSGVSSKGGLVLYQPSLTQLPITVSVGSDGTNLGLWVDLAPPPIPLVSVAFSHCGLGVPLTGLGAMPVFTFNASLIAPIEGSQGPAMSIVFDSAHGFTMGVDPLGGGQSQSTLYVELLPEPFGGGDIGKKAADWALDILINVLPRYVSLVVLNTSTVSQWLNDYLFPGNKGPTPGQVLVASQLLTQDSTTKKYALNSFANLQQLTVETFFANFIKTLLQTSIQIVTLNKTGGIWIGPQPDDANAYGIVVAVPNLSVKEGSGFTVQLGADLKDWNWISETGGPSNVTPGIGIYVPVTDDTPQFDKLRLQLVNIGVDFTGSSGKPLIDMSRFSMQAISPRALIDFDFSKDSLVTAWGGAIKLDNIAISLAPNTVVSGASTNPVAQNLLGSGSSDSPDKNNPATNPGFSAAIAYGSYGGSGKLDVALIDSEGNSAEQIWIPVQRSFGPLHANQIGIGWQSAPKIASVLFDGSVALAGLEVDLDRLAVGIPVTDPTNYSAYSLDLAGIDVSFNGGGVELSGGLLKDTIPFEGGQAVSYDGQVLVKASGFTILGLGSYAALALDASGSKTAQSFFAFVNLNMPLGGPPAFFVTGLAFGFAYNRNITLPDPGDILQFPLVQGAVSSSYFGGSGTTPGDALKKLSTVVYPEVGQYWLCAGLRFTSFQLLDTFALLFVKFGKTFEIDLVGVTSATLPPKVPKSASLAYIELGIVISFKPDEGVISVQAQLTPNSYLFAPDCRLTGGFATFLWYDPPQTGTPGPKPGDFVITLGGYHPAFVKPDWYPDVPRLGFNWPLGPVSISGGAYFALTPSAIMAGGSLNVLFEAGPLRAWLNAGADMLIQWKPFFFIVDIGVDIGVEFHTEILGVSVTLKVELGANLHLQGPPVGGYARVHWYIISFTVPIGDGGPKQPTLDWDTFAQSFLPPANTSSNAAAARASALAAGDPAPVPIQPLTAKIPQGLLSTETVTENSASLDEWVVQSIPFTLEVDTAIPATSSTLQLWAGPALPGGPAMGVQPCAASSVTTPLQLTIYPVDANGNVVTSAPVKLDTDAFTVTAVISSAPLAMWSQAPFNPSDPPSGKELLLDGAVRGIQIAAVADVNVPKAGYGPIDLLKAFSFTRLPTLNLPFWQAPKVTPAPAMDQTGALAKLMATIMDPTVVIPARTAILAALSGQGIPIVASPDLSVIAAAAWALYQAPPTLAALTQTLAAPGVQVAAAVQQAAPPAPVAAAVAAAAAVGAPVLLGALRRYRIAQPAITLQVVGTLPRLEPELSLFASTFFDQTRPDAALQRSFLGTGTPPAGGLGVRMGEGAVAICGVDPRAQTQVQGSGALSVRAFCFDKNSIMLGDILVPPNAAPQAVPAGTAVVGLQGIPATVDAAAPVGWQADANVTRVAFGTFVGDGYLVRLQAPPAYSANRDVSRFGMHRMEDLIAENRVQAIDGIKPGWVETALPSSVTAVAVLVSGADVNANALSVWIGRGESPAATAPLTPTLNVPAAGGAIIMFDVPAPSDADDAAAQVVARVLAGKGVVLTGIYGIHASSAQTTVRWTGLALPGYGISVHDTSPPTTRISIQSLPGTGVTP